MSEPSTAPTVAEPEPKKTTIFQKVGGGITLFLLIGWAVGGIAAIIMSLVCFGYSGSTIEKILGIALAFFLGPLYFIFYAVNKNYCRDMSANVVTVANRMMGGFKAVPAVSATSD